MINGGWELEVVYYKDSSPNFKSIEVDMLYKAAYKLAYKYIPKRSYTYSE